MSALTHAHLVFSSSSLCAFSITYCIAICTVLIPTTLLFTFAAIYWLKRQRPQLEVRLAAALGSLAAIALVLHVFSWILLGVVMAPTYILLSLAALCFSLNLWVVTRPLSLLRNLSFLSFFVHRRYSMTFCRDNPN
ncbi:MAG: hypothetical protein WCA07_08185 [Gloeobacterales cyanobacterium]